MLIVSGTGQLGNAVGKYFATRNNEYEVYATTRDFSLVYEQDKIQWLSFDAMKDSYTELLSDGPFADRKPDIVLNSLGVIKPFIEKNIEASIYLNAMFPHEVARITNSFNSKAQIFHINSDCCFSGKEGNYTEDSIQDCVDLYGKTKSLSAPKNAMTILTSIIGTEIHNNASLIAWAKSQAGKEVNGYRDHIWSGITTKQYAHIVDEIIQKNLYQAGTFHLYSNKLNKAELLQAISDRFELNLKINVVDSAEAIDRSLSSVKDLINKVNIPTIQEQIKDL